MLALVGVVCEGSLCIEPSLAIQAESRTEKEANLKGQAQGGLFNRWTFDQQKSGEIPAGFSMLGFGEGPAADWTIKADADAPSASNILAVNSSCQSVTCYRLIVADGFQYEYPDVSVRMRFPVGGATGAGGFFLKNLNIGLYGEELHAHARRRRARSVGWRVFYQSRAARSHRCLTK